MKDIIIIGAGGVGKETIQLIRDINKVMPLWNIIGIVDDNKEIIGKSFNGVEVIGETDSLNSIRKSTYAVCTISNAVIKKRVIEKVNNRYIEYANLIHPTAVIGEDVILGFGNIIQAYCVVTTNIIIGNHVQLNPQCGIGHDCIIKNYTSLYWNVNISGNVIIGEGCVLGTKTTVIQGKNIGDWTITGANSTIISDIPQNCTVVGTPARMIKSVEVE